MIIGAAVAGILNSVAKIGGKLIVDQDKKAEFAFKIQELTFALLDSLIKVQTIPWVDALVKLMVASVSMARPIGTALMTAAGLYFHYKQIPMDTAMTVMLDGAFPTWVAMREVDKSRKHKERISKVADDDEWDD